MAQFRFTPPTHALLAFARALEELREEGGVSARAARYRANHETLRTGMRRLGFAEYLPAERQSNIITAFRYPDDPNFRFEDFYQSSPCARFRHLSRQVEPGRLLSDRNHRPHQRGRRGRPCRRDRRSAWRDRLLRSSGFTDFLIAPMTGTSITNDTSLNRLAAACSSAFSRTRARDCRLSSERRKLTGD